jgi:hypothetical protein
MKVKFYPFRLPLKATQLTAMSFRNKGHLLFNILTKLNIAISGKTRTSLCRGTYIVIQRMLAIHKAQGLKGLTTYLKSCSVSCQQALGGHVHPNLTDLNCRVSRTARGIPTILPVLWRQLIFTDPLMAKYILTIFAVYRFFLFESPVKVKAITDPFSGSENALAALRVYIPVFFRALTSMGAFPDNRKVSPEVRPLFPILTQSPTSTRTVKGMIWSSHRVSVLRAWVLLSTHPDYFKTWSSLMAIAEYFNTPLYLELYHSIARFIPKVAPYMKGSYYLGRLGLKQEAAGKMRVFAMVDPITQWVLYPIHRFIFDEILQKLPMDGTFNQLAPLERTRSWLEMYSLDLSSATDRLPMSIQTQIINFIWPGLGDHWEVSLVERQYYNPDTSSGLKYAVGQPMGAYSSWAMLALTHHFIVQVSAWKACVVPVGVFFTEYAVLGDDIVIGNKAVKDSYLRILSDLGVECGLHKSLLSPSGTALEFAKRTWHLGKDVSPLTVKELVACLLSTQNLVSFMRNHQVSLPSILKIAGYGYKVLGGLNKPFYKLNGHVRDIILSTLLPCDDVGSTLGRSSLTRYVWEPTIGNPVIIGLLNNMFQEVLNSLFRYLCKPNKAIEMDVTIFSIKTKQLQMQQVLTSRINQTVDALKHPVWSSMTEPTEVLREYLYVMREAALIKGMSNTELASAKFGIDPFNVKLWKTWSKAISGLNKVQVESPKNKDISMKFLSSSILPIRLSILWNIFSRVSQWGAKFNAGPTLPVVPKRGKVNIPLIKPSLSYSGFISSVVTLVGYSLEMISMVGGIILTLFSMIILYDPSLFVFSIVPFLVSILGKYYTTLLLNGVGITYIPPVETWYEWAYSYTWIVTSPINFGLSILDYGVSSLVSYYKTMLSILLGLTGYMGIWAMLKTASLIKLVYAHTIGIMTVNGLGGPVAAILTFVTQILVLVFVEPLTGLLTNFSLQQLVLFILPDPLGMWNFFITLNLLPWTLSQALLGGISIVLQDYILQSTIDLWNAVTLDITWLSNYQIGSTAPDIITYIFGPMDARLGSIIQSISTLRSIWR